MAGVVLLVVAAAGIGWIVGSNIQSPAEIAADAEPPPPSNITVEVSRQVLSADVIARGDVTYDEPVQVSLSGSFADQPEKLIVTHAVEANTDLAEGDLVVEVTGRPVFLMVGEIPMYRDLRPGASGDDVLQVEEALSRLGFLTTTPDDTWDEETGAAVTSWYAEAGYRASGLSEEDEASLQGARDRVRSAEIALSDSRSALSQARQGAGRSAILAAEGEVTAATDALALARLDAERAREVAAQDLASATAGLAAAEKALAVALAASPPTPTEELASLRAEVTAAELALGEAEHQVDRVAAEQSAMVASAENRLAVAKAALSEARRGPDTSGMAQQIAHADSELAAARADLAQLESELGTWIPAGELVFLKRLPVRVDQVSVARGSEISGSFVTVSGSELTVRSSVPTASARLMEEGMEVLIENPETREGIFAVVSSLADRPGTNGLTADRVYFEIEPVDDLPEELIGANVKLTIPVSSTGGEVLAVPAAALFATADGSTIVEVEDAEGELRTVRVEIGLAAGGLVEITPLDGEIAEGSLVVVGRADGSVPGEPATEDTAETPEDA